MLFIAQAASGSVIALISPGTRGDHRQQFQGPAASASHRIPRGRHPGRGRARAAHCGRLRLDDRLALDVHPRRRARRREPAARASGSRRCRPSRMWKIDLVGAAIVAVSVILLSFGSNGLSSWGVLLAGPNAPFNIAGLSPAPVLIVLGIVGAQLFFVWTRRRKARGQVPALRSLGAQVGIGQGDHARDGRDAVRRHRGELPDTAVLADRAGTLELRDLDRRDPVHASIFVASSVRGEPVLAVRTAAHRQGGLHRRGDRAHPARVHDLATSGSRSWSSSG